MTFPTGQQPTPGTGDAGNASQGGQEGAGNSAAEENNTSGQVDLASYFMQEPEQEENPATPTSPQTPAQAPTPAANPLEALQQQIGGMQFGALELDDAGMQQLAEGDLSGLSSAVSKMQQATVMNTLKLVAPILQNFQTEMTNRMEQHTQAKLTEANQSAEAAKVFQEKVAYASDPALGSFARMAFDHAMKINKGDSTKATEMANSYINGMVKKMADTQGASTQARQLGTQLEGEGFDAFLGR